MMQTFKIPGYPGLIRQSKKDYKHCVMMHLDVIDSNVPMGYFVNEQEAQKELQHLRATNKHNKRATFKIVPVVVS